jgi:hypothetical protein
VFDVIVLEVNVLGRGRLFESRDDDRRPPFVSKLDGIGGYDPLSIRIVCETCWRQSNIHNLTSINNV